MVVQLVMDVGTRHDESLQFRPREGTGVSTRPQGLPLSIDGVSWDEKLEYESAKAWHAREMGDRMEINGLPRAVVEDKLSKTRPFEVDEKGNGCGSAEEVECLERPVGLAEDS